jgi:hypothetical protein
MAARLDRDFTHHRPAVTAITKESDKDLNRKKGHESESSAGPLLVENRGAD